MAKEMNFVGPCNPVAFLRSLEGVIILSFVHGAITKAWIGFVSVFWNACFCNSLWYGGRNASAYGHYVKIRYDDDYRTAYAHLCIGSWIKD